MDFLSPFIVAIVIVVLSVMYLTVIIPEGQAAALEHLGVFQYILTPGLHFMIPGSTLKRVNWTYTEEISGSSVTKHKTDHLIPFKKKVIFDPETVHCLTLDKIKVKVNLVITYQIVDVKKCIYEVEDLYRALQSAISSATQQVVQGSSIDSLLKDRGNIIVNVRERLSVASKWGVEIDHIDLQELDIPSSIIKATEKMITLEKEMEAKQKAELANRELELCIKDTQLEMQLRDQKATLERVQASIKAEKIAQIGKAEIESQKAAIDAKAEHDRLAILFNNDSSKIANYLTDKLFAEALTNSKGKTLIIPTDTSKFLGTSSSLSFLKSAVVDKDDF